MANENNNKEREKYSLNVTEFEPFNATKAARVITTQNLAILLNERIKPAFADYRGCFIEPLPNGQGLSVTLTFNQVQHEEGNAYAFESIESQRGQGDIASRAAHLYSEFSNGRKWKITFLRDLWLLMIRRRSTGIVLPVRLTKEMDSFMMVATS